MLIDFQPVFKKEKTLIDLANEYSHADLGDALNTTSMSRFRSSTASAMSKRSISRLILTPMILTRRRKLTGTLDGV